MTRWRRIVDVLPEYYLIILVLLAGYTPPLTLHPINAGLIVILLLQARYKYDVTGIILGSLFVLVNIYMLAAVISEFSEFPAFHAEAMKLLFIGLLIFIINLLASAIMIFKYTIQRPIP